MSFQEVKICLLGDSGVGKSSLVQRFVHNTFNVGNESTIGASYMTKTFVMNNRTLKFNIWDTAGQEKYRALAPMYYRGSAACVIVFDVTSMASYKSVHSWVRELQSHASSKVVLVLAGNKSDLERREVPLKDARAFADNIGALFIETSAKSSHNVQELFCNLANKLPPDSLKATAALPENHYISLNDSNKAERRGCCFSNRQSRSP